MGDESPSLDEAKRGSPSEGSLSLDKIKKLAGGIDSPFEVFKIVCDEINPYQAALLLHDNQKGCYFPIILRGLDQTTAIRLNINDELTTDLFDKKLKLQKYFSYSDGKNLNEYEVTDLSKEGQKILFLYTTKKNQAMPSTSFLLDNLELIIKKIHSYNIAGSSSSTKEITNLFLVSTYHFIQSVNSRNKSFYLFYIDAKESIDKLISLEGLHRLYSYRYENQLYDLLINYFDEFGIVTRLNYAKFLIFFQLPNILNYTLLEHHLNFSLSTHFNTNNKWKKLSIVTTKYYDTNIALQKFIRSFLQSL